MTKIPQLSTQRLILRQWQAKDRLPFSLMNANPKVMEFFPEVMSDEQSTEQADRFSGLIAEKGWGFWVVERREDQKFIGIAGLNAVTDLPIGDCIEVGWRLDLPFWRNGYGTEAAIASMKFAFEELGSNEIVAITAKKNLPSQALMKKLGMRKDVKSFQHPKLPKTSTLREHVSYKISQSSFAKVTIRTSIS